MSGMDTETRQRDVRYGNDTQRGMRCFNEWRVAIYLTTIDLSTTRYLQDDWRDNIKAINSRGGSEGHCREHALR